MIVLDSSAALDFLLGTSRQAWVDQQLEAAGWSIDAPYVLDTEVFAVVRARVLDRSISAAKGREVLAAFGDLPVRRYPHLQLFDRMWGLRAHVSTRDAAFVALAEALDAPLVTTDLRLARAHGFRTTVVVP